MPVGIYVRQIGLVRKPIEVRFWRKVNKDGPVHPTLGTQCWLWTASTQNGGYGQIRTPTNDKRKLLRANRLSWEIAFGPVPDGLFVLHHCDNPPCVNPDHLWLGTKADNNNDRSRKGRNGIRGL